MPSFEISPPNVSLVIKWLPKMLLIVTKLDVSLLAMWVGELFHRGNTISPGLGSLTSHLYFDEGGDILGQCGVF